MPTEVCPLFVGPFLWEICVIYAFKNTGHTPWGTTKKTFSGHHKKDSSGHHLGAPPPKIRGTNYGAPLGQNTGHHWAKIRGTTLGHHRPKYGAPHTGHHWAKIRGTIGPNYGAPPWANLKGTSGNAPDPWSTLARIPLVFFAKGLNKRRRLTGQTKRADWTGQVG